MWPSLLYGDVPGWFLDEGGFGDDKATGRWWPRFAAWAAETFGDRVAGWMPLHDPVGYALDAYLNGVRPPGRTSPDDFTHVLANLVVAWREAARELRGGAPVATAIHLPPLRGDDSTPAARRATADVDAVFWRVWLRALTDGVVSVPGRGETELADLAGSADIVGILYSHAITVDEQLGFHHQPPTAEGLAEVLHRLAEELPDQPLLVAAQRTPTVDDNGRVALLREIVDMLGQARSGGIDLRGWFHEPAFDTADEQLGLFTVDRSAKDSALEISSLQFD